ncbi:MAG TPA: DegV family protein [Clostridia bacterium]|nr:DegV family protein [Clostridia bacterium]
MTVQVFTDSTSYIDSKTKKELQITTVPLNVSFNDISFKETEIDNSTFYQLMKKKGIPQSSQPTFGDLYETMQLLLKKSKNLLGIFISSEMSGTYATAQAVKKKILQENKEASIEIIDSRSNCMQLGFAVIQAAKAALLGKSLAEVKNAAEKNIERSKFLFIPANLEYLKKGGRIGGAAALLGHILKIIPILTVKNGQTAVFKKIRTQKKALQTMIETMAADIEHYGLGEVIVHHINCLPEATSLANQIKEKLQSEVKILDIGPVIGLHVGPGAIGIAYYTQQILTD